MSDDRNNSVVAIYESHERAENAIKKLTAAKIPMSHLSVIGKGYHTDEKVVGFYNAGDRMQFWGKYGAFWGGLWGLMAGGLFVTIPVIGPIVVLGQAAVVVLGAIEGAAVVGSVSALAAGLFSIGIPKDTIVKYEEAIKANNFVVLVQGTVAEVEEARALLEYSDARQVNVHRCETEGKSGHILPKLKVAS